MVAILTGDIIDSRKTETVIWVEVLKKILVQHGSNPTDWELYRGDSFQLITSPEQALHIAMVLKAELKKIKTIDVRIAIGIGEIDYRAHKITESNGSAFIQSGSCFDALKKQTLAIKTPWEDYNQTIQLMINWATFTIDNWSEKTAEIIALKLQNPDLNQKEIAQILNKKGQGNISETLKRGGYKELNQLLNYYQKTIQKLC
jgi:DNA-binding transcriptional regulator WhiA